MHGLSTLNRLLGKKNKEASRSTTNLSKSTSNLDTSSQHNRISPIVNNAPFEQTFRVTVYLPKNQLYVERIGAKTKLATLMDKICENKHLSPEKYEFRHPGDASQSFDTEKTIGEVGLNELKLALKTESRFNSDFHRFHADDMMKYKSSVPDSVSSSEISRNYGKTPMQKASPYSSTTSLNSLDSTGMNLTAKTQAPVAPVRKKRAAPRPPSTTSIPEQEQEIFGTTLNVFKEPHSILPRKNFHVSSPQLFAQKETRSDKNNNIETGNRLNAITRPTSLFVASSTDIHHNGRQRSPSVESSEVQNILHERQNSNSLEKKKKPAPVPPKRVHKPVPSPRTVQEDSKPPTITEIKEIDEQQEIVPHLDGNISKTMLNNIPQSEDSPSIENSDGPISIQIVSTDSSIEPVKESETSPKLPTVSKVHIKLDEERRSSSEEDEMTVNIYNVTKSVVTLEKTNQVTVEKASVVTVEKANHVTVEKTSEVIVEKTSQVTAAAEMPVKVEEKKPEAPIVREITVEIEQRPQSPHWTYTLPAPPVFADSSVVDKASPTDNQKHGDKFFSDFASTDCNETVMSDNTTVISAETHIHPIIVDRMSREESFIMTPTDFTKKVQDDASDKSTEIITSDVEDGYLGNGTVVTVETPKPTPVEKEIVIEEFKRSRLIITRSDSFHSIGQTRNMDISPRRGPLSPPQRSTSFLSLVQSQKAEILSNKSSNDNAPYSRQKSNSELSISDSPSLQSLEVIKNILNSSRKNSLQDVKETVNDNKQQQPPPPPKPEEETAKKPSRQISEPAVEPKKPETQWRYSGPPKINLSTWNERPSSKVAIAADSDYKFGGVAATMHKYQQDVTSKRHTIHISNDRVAKEEAEKHLPKVLGVEYKKDVSPVQLRNTSSSSSSEIVTKPTRTIINIKPRPMSVEISNSYSTLVTSTSSTSPTSVSFNRLNSNAKKFTPVVHGFKLNNIKEGGDVVSEPIVVEKKLEPPSVPAKPTFLRSTSAGDINRKAKLTVVESPPTIDETDFTQTGLRKTGLKEKILLHDKKTESIFGRVIENNPSIHIEKPTLRQMSVPVPPKPPTAPPMSFRKSAPVNFDNRNQLLDAIKNFNMDSLRHK